MSSSNLVLPGMDLLSVNRQKLSTCSNASSETDETDPYQRDLEQPPIPTLNATFDRLVEYASVIADDKQLAKTKKLIDEFKAPNGGAKEAQKAIEKCAIRKDNWINRFWMDDMYLANRAALPLNSNPAYIFPPQTFANDVERIRYAAALIRGLYSFKNMIDTRSLPQDESTGREKVPLCMDQYWRLFTSYRQPALPKDKQHTNVHRRNGNNEHVIVMCGRMAFVVRTVMGGEQLPINDLVYQLNEAERMAQNKCAFTTIPVGAFTAADRDLAAKTLNELLQDDTNRASFNWVETASFVICLDDDVEVPPAVTVDSDMPSAESRLAVDAHHILHGFGSEHNGLNRWYDKTQHLIITRHGCTGLLIEHSIAEGIVIINMVEEALKVAKEKVIQSKMLENTDSKEKAEERERMLSPKQLEWHISPSAKKLLSECSEKFDKSAQNLQMNVLIFDDYGKDQIKKFKCSPDAYIQLMLQLAYFRTHNHLCSTYESAAIRRFKKGRVDNIRASHPQALAWVKCMQNESADHHQKRVAFKIAMEKQTSVMLENVNGHGIDNHLTALRILSIEQAEEKNKDPPKIFQDEIYQEIMRFPLSTSQVTTKEPDSFLCYGPVTPDGYGCAYNLQSNQIIFGISAFKDCDWTNAVQFRRNLQTALADMKALQLIE